VVYCDILYFVNGHKRYAGSEYKQMAYVFTMHPGNRIRELRKQAKLSQSELAQRSGVSQPYISQIENQDGLSLDIARMRVLAREFDCTPADLLTDADNPDRLSAEERDLIAQFRAAGDNQREMIRRVAEPLPSREVERRKQAA
jgi:transcriptional regulator with XRE-family HTH domain